MGRSGTSLTARLLHLCGLYLGDEADMLPAHESNAKGHWEHRQILELNDRILALFDGSWHNPPTLPPMWTALPEVVGLREEAVAFVARTFGGHAAWGWKEPRTTVTIPFWRQVVPEVRFAVCVRNPLDVAVSLRARDRTSLTTGVALWHYYTDLALRSTQPEERMLVQYEHFFRDYREELAPLLDFARLPPLQSGSAEDRAVSAFIDRGLRHHQHSYTDVMENPYIEPCTKELYTALVHQPDAVPSLIASSLEWVAQIRALISAAHSDDPQN